MENTIKNLALTLLLIAVWVVMFLEIVGVDLL